MCVQNDMLTIAGEGRMQNGTHPNLLPKTLTGPDLKPFGLVQTCRGMRGFTDFHLCPIRAQRAPVSAHLSICRNFTTARSGLHHRGATGCRGIARRGPVTPCMHVQARPTRRSRRHPVLKTGIEARLRGGARYRSTCPGAHCTAHRNQRVPKILTLSARHSVTWIPIHPRHTRDPQPAPPEKPHLNDKSGVRTDAKAAPENSHRNRRGIKNVNGIRYLCASCVRLCRAIVPRKASPLRHSSGGGSRTPTPENSHLCQKLAQRKSDFRQSRWAFRPIPHAWDPGKSHL